MDTLKLSELIGQNLLELRFQYDPENEYGLQSFHSYIKLSSDVIIDIPDFDDEVYLRLTQSNLSYFNEMFETGELIPEKLKSFLVGQTILDFYFSYSNNEIDCDFPALIKLSNGYYLTEKRFGPIGIYVDLILLDKNEFEKEVKRRNDINIQVRSFITMKNAC